MVRPNDLRVRQFRPVDYPMICDWAFGHRRSQDRLRIGWRPPPLEMLPQISVIVYQLEPLEDLAVCWLYLTRECPVCFVDHLVTKPGLTLRRAREAVLEALGYMKFFAAQQGYLIMKCYTGAGAGRVLQRAGWLKSEAGLAEFSSATFEIPVLAGQLEVTN